MLSVTRVATRLEARLDAEGGVHGALHRLGGVVLGRIGVLLGRLNDIIDLSGECRLL